VKTDSKGIRTGGSGATVDTSANEYTGQLLIPDEEKLRKMRAGLLQGGSTAKAPKNHQREKGYIPKIIKKGRKENKMGKKNRYEAIAREKKRRDRGDANKGCSTHRIGTLNPIHRIIRKREKGEDGEAVKGDRSWEKKGQPSKCK